jgi:hypothetical protein
MMQQHPLTRLSSITSSVIPTDSFYHLITSFQQLTSLPTTPLIAVWYSLFSSFTVDENVDLTAATTDTATPLTKVDPMDTVTGTARIADCTTLPAKDVS